MKTYNILLRDFPDEVHEELKKMAKIENISLNDLCLRIIDESLKRWERGQKEKKDQDKIMRRLETIRKKRRLKMERTR